MKSSSGYEIYHNTLSSCLDEIEDYVQSKGYQVGEYFPLVNHVSYGQTERTSLEMLKNGNVANTLSIQIYRMDSGRYELNCYPVRKFSGGGKVLWAVKKGEPDWKEQIITEKEEQIEDAKKWATENGFDRLRIQVLDLSTPPDFKKTFKTGGYTRPAYDLKTTGNYLFRTNKGTFDITSYLFERENDTEDALEIQDDLRGTIGSVIIKNSAWKNLSSGKSVKARSSKGDYFGTLVRVGDNTRTALKFSGGGSTDEGIDLFEDYENIPPQVMAILNEYAEGIEDGDYNAMGDAQNELEKIGYTFDYYVDGSAFDLRPIGTKGKTQDYGTGGGVGSLIEWIDFSETDETDTEQRYSSSTDFALKLRGDNTIYNGTFNYGSLSDSIDWVNSPAYSKVNTNDLEEYVTSSYFKHNWGEKYSGGGGVKTLKVGDRYLYKFDNKVYEVLGVGIKQVALAPLPISSYWNNWIVSKTLMERWVKNKTMIKQK